MKHLYYIRHGQTADNRQHHWGKYDTPLDTTGREQARNAGRLIKGRRLAFDVIIASPQPRTQETARIIANEIAYNLEDIETMEQLVERRMGPLCGSPYDEFFAGGKVYRDLDAVEGVEPLPDVQRRAESAFLTIRQRPERHILVVSHGAFGRAFHRAVMGLPYEDEYLTAQPHDIIDNATLFRLV